MKRGDLVTFWHPRMGGYHLGRFTRFHRNGKVRVRRLHKRESFALEPAKLQPVLPLNPDATVVLSLAGLADQKEKP